jgi:hypothetical protein
MLPNDGRSVHETKSSVIVMSLHKKMVKPLVYDIWIKLLIPGWLGHSRNEVTLIWCQYHQHVYLWLFRVKDKKAACF